MTVPIVGGQQGSSAVGQVGGSLASLASRESQSAREVPTCPTIEPTSPGPYVILMLTWMTLMLTSPGPHVLFIWQGGARLLIDSHLQILDDVVSDAWAPVADHQLSGCVRIPASVNPCYAIYVGEVLCEVARRLLSHRPHASTMGDCMGIDVTLPARAAVWRLTLKFLEHRWLDGSIAAAGGRTTTGLAKTALRAVLYEVGESVQTTSASAGTSPHPSRPGVRAGSA